MIFPSSDTPLYNHPLPAIEQWLSNLGCQQDLQNLNCWTIRKPSWNAQISLEIEELAVCYLKAGADGSDIKRAFKYSLSRQDIEAAVFGGP
ncbi:DUF3143 domain-containing protein [Crocosphaera sp. UHCC 0190]|uniref:DUF3143 domain-containing protein n=1 Tax=Crocosphaera sp. UHCC 0190 TaxID=3110246 RepID=UPI002B1FC70E|nr:DUF3143 domain-containing protein [Crocosphaera sp. UHCC 0190]MEA5509217.1 DUF3143 domain-containing protein [Crocosphaera sp. UHCC 0190]